MNEKKNLIDRNRRTVIKAGVWVGALALQATRVKAVETLTYPSRAEILPPEWRDYYDCVYTATAIPGPYFVDDSLVRNDIRDGKEGQQLQLKLQIVDVNAGCVAVPSAIVEIWHCDAGGWYSGYPTANPDELPQIDNLEVTPQSGETFLRGTQVSDAQGWCEFRTIFPGWYTGRTVHIHAKVHLEKSHLVTTQFYFPQELIDEVHRTSIYKARDLSPYRNNSDSELFASSGAAGGWPNVARRGNDLIATLRIGVLIP